MALFDITITVQTPGSNIAGDVVVRKDITTGMRAEVDSIMSKGLFIPDGSGGGTLYLPRTITSIRFVAV